MFPYVLPVYMQTLQVPEALLGWVTAISTFAAILIRPFCGFILDRFGRKGVLITGIILMGLASVSYAVFPFLGALLVIRFIHGLAWGVASTACQTAASDVIPPQRFGEGMGIFALSASLALAISPGVALGLFDNSGFSSVIFAGTGVLCVGLVLAFFLRYKTVTNPTAFTWKGILEKHSIVPSLIMFFISYCYGALITFLALHAKAQGVEDIGLFFTAYALAVALSRPLLGKLIDQRGFAITLVPGLLVMSLALVLLSIADSSAFFTVVGFVFGFGFAACNSTLQAMAVAGIAINRRGAANATYMVGFDSGIGVGAIVSGFIVSAIGYSGLYVSCAILPLVAGVIYLLFARDRKPPALSDTSID